MLRTGEYRNRRRRPCEQFAYSIAFQFRFSPEFAFPFDAFTAQASHVQLRLYTRKKFPSRERLAQKVIGAGAQPFDTRFLSGSCGKQNHWNTGGPFVSPQSLQQVEPIELRHHDVAEYQVRRMLANRMQRGLPIGDGLDIANGREKFAQIPPHVRVVIRQQNAGTVPGLRGLKFRSRE